MFVFYMLVKEVMVDPFVIEKDIKLVEAAKLMNQHNTDCLIFMSGDKVKGIITERDLLKNFNDKKKVSQAMTREVITIDPDKDLNEALALMNENKIKRLPVVMKDELIGIITVTDLLANADELDESFFF